MANSLRNFNESSASSSASREIRLRPPLVLDVFFILRAIAEPKSPHRGSTANWTPSRGRFGSNLNFAVLGLLSKQDRPQIGLIPGVALITIILALMLCGLFRIIGRVLRQLTRVKKSRRSSEAMLSVEDVPPGYKYEVFLSFIGSNTHNNFTDCLYHRLRIARVHVFLDKEELRVSKEIDGELLKVLNKSRIYIPIFSQNYATSSWCLDEVAHMRWEDALVKVANLKGWELKGKGCNIGLEELAFNGCNYKIVPEELADLPNLRFRIIGGVLRQPTRMKKRRRSSEAIQSVEDLPPVYEYDVFLSFRGPDTRSTFTDCLYHRLRDVGVNVFLDNEELRVGKEISGELLKALVKSQIYIPIFSQDYATSSWCLREVAYMVEHTSNSDGKKEILPIFYDVNPDDVKLKSELYKKAISEHEKKFGSDELKRYGELSGLVVEEVLLKLNAINVDVPEYWVEDHHQIEDVLKKLAVDSNDVRFLGIHGIGGIGKTVLAKVVFNKVSSDFDSVCFLNDVRESSQHGLINVQKKLLSSLVGSLNAYHIKDVRDGMNMIKRVCHTKKVLIVLDDLDKREQLKKLAGKIDWFGSGSRIIFTTRNLEVLKTQVESSSEEVLNQPKGILAYEVHEMEFGQALQLFCKHAFRRDSPLEGYDRLAKKIVRRVGMLPLAVEVIASFLYCHSSVLEQHFDNRKLWEDTLKKLDDGPLRMSEMH
ncbi:TMV resistance protein N-like [Eucalyptus grandis]|uniref:TMV resistance protein N-like n=1 Tax=Eucalyptus grandis TaxID=71139 RepID=UPI00192EE4F4|nr:TMV resistance protein N-like [Eucalyptus grandis]